MYSKNAFVFWWAGLGQNSWKFMRWCLNKRSMRHRCLDGVVAVVAEIA